MKYVIVVKDLFSFVFFRNSKSHVCDFLKGETAEEMCGIDWRRATWNGVDWPGMAVHNQLQMKEMKRKRKAYWMYWIILLCSQPRDWMGAWSDTVPGRNVLREAHLTADILAHTCMNGAIHLHKQWCGRQKNAGKVYQFHISSYKM